MKNEKVAKGRIIGLAGPCFNAAAGDDAVYNDSFALFTNFFFAHFFALLCLPLLYFVSFRKIV